jgi:hypothetical protein
MRPNLEEPSRQTQFVSHAWFFMLLLVFNSTNYVRQNPLKMKAYPSPVSDGIRTVILEKMQVGKNVTLAMSDAFGRVVRQVLLTVDSPTLSYELNVSSLPKGIYLFSVRGEDGGHKTERPVLTER